MEKIQAIARNPAKAKYAPFRIDISQEKDGSKRADQYEAEKIKVYTNGSARKGQVGAAAILTITGKQKRTLHYHLGAAQERTVYEAELIGLILGLPLLKTEQAGDDPEGVDEGRQP